MPASDPAVPQDDIRPATIGFLLIPGFALLPYACAVEPLRAANILTGRPLYAWRHYSPDGKPTAASYEVYTLLHQRLVEQEGKLDRLLRSDLPGVNQALTDRKLAALVPTKTESRPQRAPGQ